MTATTILLSAIGAVFVAIWPVLLHGYEQAVWANFNNTAIYNFAKDLLWGWHEVSYFHDPITPPISANPPCWDVNGRIVYYIMNIDGGFIEKTPLGLSNYILTEINPLAYALWLSYENFVTQWNLAYGLNQWVWFGFYEPAYPPP
ncbi:MAG: hypothetical protein ACUVXA_14530 [Candidatus Jordarchaeum sp.]